MLYLQTDYYQLIICSSVFFFLLWRHNALSRVGSRFNDKSGHTQDGCFIQVEAAAVILPRSPSLLAPHKESRHYPKEHSSPPSSAEPELSPSLNHDLAPSLARCMFPFRFLSLSMTWQSAAQDRSGRLSRHWNPNVQDSFAVFWVWLHEICDVRRSARFSFCYTLF